MYQDFLCENPGEACVAESKTTRMIDISKISTADRPAWDDGPNPQWEKKQASARDLAIFGVRMRSQHGGSP